MGKLYEGKDKIEEDQSKSLTEDVMSDPKYFRIAKQLGITVNEVITNIVLCQEKSKRRALIESTRCITELFYDNHHKRAQDIQYSRLYEKEKKEEEKKSKKQKVYKKKEEVDKGEDKNSQEEDKVLTEYKTKVYSAKMKVKKRGPRAKCEICQCMYKNLIGLRRHMRMKHLFVPPMRTQTHPSDNQTEKRSCEDLQVQPVIQNTVLPAATSNSEIPVYGRKISTVLKASNNFMEIEQKKQLMTAKFNTLRTTLESNLLKLNAFSNKLSFILNSKEQPKREDENGRSNVKWQFNNSIANHSQEYVLRKDETVLTHVRKLIMMYQTLENFGICTQSHKQKVSSNSQNHRTSLTIEEIENSVSNQKIKETSDTELNSLEKPTFSSAETNEESQLNILDDMPVNDASKVKPRRSARLRKLDVLTNETQSTPENGLREETLPQDRNTNVNQTLADNKYIAGEAPQVSEQSENNTIIQQESVSCANVKNKKDKAQQLQHLPMAADTEPDEKSHQEAELENQKKRKRTVQLRLQKYNFGKKKQLKIYKLLRKHKDRIWMKSHKKARRRKSSIPSNIIVEDITEQIPKPIADLTATENITSVSTYNEARNLRIPLIRIDALPSFEVDKLIRNENSVGNTKEGGKRKRGRPKGSKRNLLALKTAKNFVEADNLKECKIEQTTKESSSTDQNPELPNTVADSPCKLLRKTLTSQRRPLVEYSQVKGSQEEDKLPLQTANVASTVEVIPEGNIGVRKSGGAVDDNNTRLMLPKSNSKRKQEIRNDVSHNKKLRSDTSEDFQMKNSRVPTNLFAKPENNIKLNGEIISMEIGNICHICDKDFSNRRALSEHMFFIHDANLDNAIVSQLLDNYTKGVSFPVETTDISKDGNTSEQESYDNFTMENFVEEEQEQNNEEEPSKEEEQEENEEEEEQEDYEVPYNEIVYCNVDVTKGSRKWRCKMCKENFGLLRNYLRHKYYSHNDETVVHICDNCTKVLTSVAMVNVHVCTNVRSWICRRCNLEFPNGISLGRHNINRHLEVVGPHTCNICDLNFLTSYMLERHKTLYHKSVGITKEKNSLFCENATSDMNYFQALNVSNCSLSRAFWLPKKEEVEDYALSSSGFYSSFNKRNQCTCIICNKTFPTKLLMKLHLEKRHNVNMDICQLCNDLFPTGSVTRHLIDRHIISDNIALKGEETQDKIKLETMEDSQYDLLKVLGLTRLVSIYSYQKFSESPRNEQYNCHVCLRKFSTAQEYKFHYLKEHDEMCIFCNVKFENNVKAMDHRLNAHKSADAYLWGIQSIVVAILNMKKQNTLVDDMTERFKYIKICDANSASPSRKGTASPFISSFKTEILEVASGHNTVTLYTKVECDGNASQPSTSAQSTRRPLNGINSIINTSANENAIESVLGVNALKDNQNTSNNSVSIILVTEEDLWLYKDNIQSLAAKLCSSCTMYSEDYITVLLTSYMQTISDE